MPTTITYNSSITFTPTNTNYVKYAKISSTSFLQIYSLVSGSNINIICRVCIHSGGTITTYGTTSVIYTSTSYPSSMDAIKVNILSDNKIVIFYPMFPNYYGVVGNISGSSITFGSSTLILKFSGSEIAFASETIDSNNIISNYNGTIQKFNASGNTITQTYNNCFGFPSSTSYATMNKLDSSLFIISAMYYDGSYYQLVLRLFNSATNTMYMLSTPSVKSNFVNRYCNVTVLNNSQFILTYTDGSCTTVSMRIGTVSGNNVTYGDLLTPEPSVQNQYISDFSVSLFNPSLAVIFYSYYTGDNYYIRSRIINISGNTLTSESYVSIEDNVNSDWVQESLAFSSNSFAGVYKNSSGIVFKYGTIPILGKKINGITYTKWNGTTVTKWNNQ